jgi:L-asparaginase II
MPAVPLAEVTRGTLSESRHLGHAVVCGPDGEIEAAWGDPALLVLPRSACKMVQALPLAEAEAGLAPERLALACASHAGTPAHVAAVAGWLAANGLAAGDLRCGAHAPLDRAAAEALLRDGARPSPLHNNCSGKHAGFLHLARAWGGAPDYLEPDHPVQRAARAALEETAQEASPAWAVDGCSAPNFAVTLAGLGRAMAGFATAASRPGARARAQERLVAAMIAHPELVAGQGRACTELMRASAGRAAVKTGAEGVYVAILPGTGRGLALKVEDGATRAAEAAVAALLVRLGAVAPEAPAALRLMAAPIRNWRGVATGTLRALL